MLSGILTSFLGIILFLFFFWRRLKEDYPINQIFTTAFYVLVGILAGFLLSKKFFPSAWFWAEFLGVALGFALGVLRYKLRLFESLEALSVSLLIWLGVYFLKDSIVATSLPSFLSFFAVTCLITFYAYLDAHYKLFSWYASGKAGFSGLATLGLFFLVRAGFASFFPFVISFVDKYEAILSGVAAFIFFLATFNLARQK